MELPGEDAPHAATDPSMSYALRGWDASDPGHPRDRAGD
jgi:hypothetical protein